MKKWEADLSGITFGRLTVLRLSPVKAGRSKCWVCQCSCGAIVEKPRPSLVTGHAKSCGCLNRDSQRAAKKHGMCNSPEYATWKDMKRRCLNPNAKNYYRYGGRGISIHPSWMSFAQFVADMGKRPSSDHSIERIDNDGNYEPGNCCWATNFEQASNTSRNRFVTVGGKTQTVSQWARELGVSRFLIRDRLDNGLPPLEAVFGSILR